LNIDEVAKIVDIFAKLLGVLVWPTVIIFILYRFGRVIGDLISSLTEFSFKGAGFEASGKRKTEAAAALGAALAKQQEASPETSVVDPRRAGQIVEDALTPRIFRQAGKSHILWVDDKPANNVNERASLEAIGVNFILAKSTDEALVKIREQSFNAVISDMGRPGDSKAGLTLLEKMRSAGNLTPYIIYAGSNAIQIALRLGKKAHWEAQISLTNCLNWSHLRLDGNADNFPWRD
jgi:CheY-like chemotaxis protein